MADKDLLNVLLTREFETMDILLSTKAKKTALTLDEYINTRLLQGASKESIKADLLNDLENGGRIFSEFRNSVKSSAVGTLNRTSDASIFSEVGIDTKYRWVAVLVNTCPDCLKRHNQVKAWSEWEQEGLPRSGMTVCRDNCHCALLPADTIEIAPVQRGK